MKIVKTILLGFAIASLFAQVAKADDDEPSVGQVAPDFTLTTLAGDQFKLSDYRGKKSVYVVFWNTWCTYCFKKIPKLKHAQSELNDEIEIIAVNTGLKDSVEKSLVFQERYEINYPLAFDHGKKVTDLYGVWGTPTEFIVDINGIIRYRDDIPEQLSEHLAEWNQPIAETQLASNDKNCTAQNSQTC